MATSIESLPLEIQQIVLEYLSTYESSLRAFAHANWTCLTLASPFLYHTIQVRVDPDADQVSIGKFYKWTQAPQTLTRLKYVKCLVICENKSEARSRSSDSKDTGPPYIFLTRNPITSHGYLQSYGLSPEKKLDNHKQAALESNGFWLPLVHLIPQLPRLSDLLFSLQIQFPKCLLDQIHTIRPFCRLHIGYFFLRSLPKTDMDSYEFQLASSPCLYSLKTVHNGFVHSEANMPSSCYHENAVARMASGLAPNLNEITLVYPSPGAALMHYNPPLWSGSSQEDGEICTKAGGNLRFLRLEHFFHVTGDRMDYWCTQTDFTRLQALEFDANLSSDLLRHLATFQLPCLETLVLSGLRYEREDSENHAEAVNELLKRLPPLKSLTLEAWYPEISIEGLALHHGPRLSELKLLNYAGENLTKDDLEVLGHCCPFLRDITLSLVRSQGDSTEVGLYKALGSIPRLQSILLDLHVAKTYSPLDNQEDEEGNVFNASVEDEFDRQVPLESLTESLTEACNGAMREQLINCAFDKTLAQSIFDAISSGKPQISLPLEELTVRITDPEDFRLWDYPMSLVCVLFHMCRPWRVTRNVRDDRRHEIQAEQTVPMPGQLLPLPPALEDWLEAIWRRVWPEKMSEDWKSDWHSLPLAEV